MAKDPATEPRPEWAATTSHPSNPTADALRAENASLRKALQKMVDYYGERCSHVECGRIATRYDATALGAHRYCDEHAGGFPWALSLPDADAIRAAVRVLGGL